MSYSSCTHALTHVAVRTTIAREIEIESAREVEIESEREIEIESARES